MPAARYSDLHVYQQDGPPGARSTGVAGRDRVSPGQRIAPETFVSLAHAPWAEVLDESDIAALQTDVELLDRLGISFNHDLTLAPGRHSQSGKEMRLQGSCKLFANERTVIDEAYPGDVLDLPNTGNLAIGDTLSECKPIKFVPIPRFQPELFALLRNTDVAKQKQFIKGMRQLESEGAVQVLYRLDAIRREPILAAVGKLQFDVVQARLENEYAVRTTLEPLQFTLARWVEGPEEVVMRLPNRNEVVPARDSEDNYVALFSVPFYLRYAEEHFAQLRFETRS